MNRIEEACLIFNPVSGQGEPEQDLETIRRILEPEITLDIRFTTEEKGADEIATEAIAQGAKAIIASGGDGTLSTAAAALVGKDIPLGVISRGTANAFASALNLPDTIEAACEAILGGVTRVVDAARCNDMPMVLLAGIGFEAETVERADREAKSRFGVLAYVMAGIQELRQLESFEAEIETEDKIVTVTAVSLTVANAAPPTSVLAQGPAGVDFEDGLLDITVVSPVSRARAIAATYHLLQTALNENATDRDDIGYLRAKRVIIRTNPPQKVVLDGEIIGNTPIDVESVPQGLTIFVPRDAHPDAPVEKLEGLPGLKVEAKPDAGFEEES